MEAFIEVLMKNLEKNGFRIRRSLLISRRFQRRQRTNASGIMCSTSLRIGGRHSKKGDRIILNLHPRLLLLKGLTLTL